MKTDADALIIGGGPAGASTAIGLASAGWRVILAEQHAYPRQKVCGECLAAGNFPLLDDLGVGSDVRGLCGAALERVGWMDHAGMSMADMPQGALPSDAYGRALGRDVFDSLLLERARTVGVRILQPARVRKVRGNSGAFCCDIIDTAGNVTGSDMGEPTLLISAPIIIDAHGSWEGGPRFEVPGRLTDPARSPGKASDLFGFKATFRGSRLPSGFLPVVAFPGGYGGMVVANDERTTVALCMRRDTLRAVRSRHAGLPAGIAVERHLRESCRGVQNSLRDGERHGAWLAVGPLRPGIRLAETPGIYRVGNACGETHPLVGEGMSMALQSARMLVRSLLRHADRTGEARRLSAAHRAYTDAWRTSFVPRMRFAACYAQIAMRPALSRPVGRLLRRWPALLTTAARLAGKARAPIHTLSFGEETP